jgi:2-haloacid dehalogenase
MNDSSTTVILDLGGVLIDWNPRYLYRKIFNGDEAKVDWFLTNVCTNEWNQLHDMGVLFSENANALIEKHPDYEKEIRAYQDRWAEMFGGEISESVEILSKLKKKKVPTFALTNWSAETFPRAQKMFPFLSWFDGIVVSGELKIKKPDPRIYRHLFEMHSVDPKQSVYVDDVLMNVDAARAFGAHGIHFQNPQQLADELKKKGLL